MAGNKSDNLIPRWLSHKLPSTPSMSYIFVRSHGSGATLQSARQNAFVAMSQRLEIERGLTVNTSVQTSEKTSMSQTSTSTDFQQEITLEVTEKGRQLKIVCREIDDYWEYERGEYHIDVLYTVTNTNAPGGSYDDEIIVTTKYGAAGLLSVIPGAGQFYKGAKLKGGLILGGTALLAAGIVFSESQRLGYLNLALSTHDAASKRICSEQSTNWAIGRNVCIGAASALYLYNLLDAIIAPGAKRIVRSRDGRRNYAIAPAVMPDGSAGFALTMRF